jgi:hypothetical protein
MIVGELSRNRADGSTSRVQRLLFLICLAPKERRAQGGLRAPPIFGTEVNLFSGERSSLCSKRRGKKMGLERPATLSCRKAETWKSCVTSKRLRPLRVVGKLFSLIKNQYGQRRKITSFRRHFVGDCSCTSVLALKTKFLALPPFWGGCLGNIDSFISRRRDGTCALFIHPILQGAA